MNTAIKTKQLLVTLPKFLRAGQLTGIVATVLCGLFLLAPGAAAADRTSVDAATGSSQSMALTAVGQVNFMLGKAYVEAPGQSREALSVGSSVRAGDRITTGSNGHVHIQFEDNAFVSVRPNSRLEIIKYHFNREHPEQSSVKFDLQEGVTRAISGTAAKSAREQFRLNTPIAAIGVRGTDFVVSATDSTVRALVNEGVIVMAPFSAECRADGFGPCGTNAVELAGESMQILEQNGIAALPQLLPASEASSLNGEVAIASVNATVNNEETTAEQGVFRDVVTLTKATTETGGIVAISRPPQVPVSPGTPESEPELPTVPDFTPTAPVTVVAVSSQQLVWGRYADVANPMDLMTLSFSEASVNRKVTVGNLETALFRSEPANPRVEKGLGVVSFQLNSAQASYDSASGIVAMQVTGGSLAIDFQESNFATELNLNHDLTGAIDFVANGRLFDGGYFHNTTDTQRIAGAVSLDGTEAGYFFERQLEAGNIKGLTLWDSN